MRVAVVVNPVGAADERVVLEAELDKRSIEGKWIETNEADLGIGAAREALELSPDLILACGGDGTVRATAEGAIDSGVPIGIIPAGTGNLLARNLGVPLTIEEALDVALTGRPQSLDAGDIEGEIFTVMAGAGIDAVIMNETSSESKDRLGSLAYVIEGMKHIFDDPIEATISDAESTLSRGSWGTILIGNLGRLQGGIDLFPDATPGDGILRLIGLAASRPLDAVAAGVSAAFQNHSDRLFRASGEGFTLAFDRPTRYELDGEARKPVSRIEAVVRPRSLVVMSPNRRI